MYIVHEIHTYSDRRRKSTHYWNEYTLYDFFIQFLWNSCKEIGVCEYYNMTRREAWQNRMRLLCRNGKYTRSIILYPKNVLNINLSYISNPDEQHICGRN